MIDNEEVDIVNALIEPFVKDLWNKNIVATTGGSDRGVVITCVVDGRLHRIAVTVLEADNDGDR